MVIVLIVIYELVSYYSSSKYKEPAKFFAGSLYLYITDDKTIFPDY